MDDFLQAAALVLLAVILILTIRKSNGELAVVLSIAGCCMAALVMAGYFKPVLTFFRRLQTMADVDGQLVGILWKVVGISLIGEIAASICADSGNAALGKVLQMVASAVILSLSVPMLSKLMDLVEGILGKL